MLSARKYGLLLGMVFITTWCWAQKLTATVNRNTVAVGEHFNLSFKIDGQGENFKIPSFKNFRLLSGPNQSNQMQYVNGQMSSSITYSFILGAIKEGDFKLPIASVTLNGKEIKSNEISVKVVKPSQAQQQRQQQQKDQKAAQEKQLKENIYLKMFISKNKVYQGEQVTATLKLYTRLQIVNYGFEKAPSFTGFYTQDINSKDIGQGQSEIINGVQYTTAILKKVVLSPQRSGEIKIDPTQLEVIARVRDDRAPRSFFDQFLGGYKDVEIKVQSNASSINVKPLPGNKPASFGGAVGSFKMTSSIDKQEVKANEAINLKINISGNGNIKLIKNPNLEFPPDFEVYDPKENTNQKVNESGVSGNKTFEYLIIPRHSGDFMIPAVEFSYFNANTGKYETLSTEEYPIHVLRSDGEDESVTAVRPVRKKDVALLGKDIRYIHKGNPKLKEAGSVFFGSLGFWGFLSLPLMLFGGLLLTRKRMRDMQSDTVGMKRRKAGKVASQYLSTAKKHLNTGEKNEFYEAIFHSLYKYLGMKLNIPASELDKDSIRERLKQAGVEESIIEDCIAIIGECEMARYAPSAVMNENELYDKASEVINKLDGGLK